MTTITDRDGNTHSTKRKGVNAAYVCWNWNRTQRVAGWTTKGRAGALAAIKGLAQRDDVEIFEIG